MHELLRLSDLPGLHHAHPSASGQDEFLTPVGKLPGKAERNLFQNYQRRPLNRVILTLMTDPASFKQTTKTIWLHGIYVWFRGVVDLALVCVHLIKFKSTAWNAILKFWERTNIHTCYFCAELLPAVTFTEFTLALNMKGLTLATGGSTGASEEQQSSQGHLMTSGSNSKNTIERAGLPMQPVFTLGFSETGVSSQHWYATPKIANSKHIVEK